MSASSPAQRVIIARCGSNTLSSVDAERAILVAREGEECRIDAREVLVLREGPLRRKELLDLFVLVSSGVEEVHIDCSVLEYSPLAETILVYKWLVGDEYKLVLHGGCDWRDLLPRE